MRSAGDGCALSRVRRGDGLARLHQSERLRRVLPPARIGQRRQQLRWVRVGDHGRVGLRQIEHRDAVALEPTAQPR